MSRLVNTPIIVETDVNDNPCSFILLGGRGRLDVIATLSYSREWIGILQNEPERDVWRVETTQGIAQVHALRRQTEDDKGEVVAWFLHAWED